MKVLLVRPPRIKQAITLSDFMFAEPLGLEMIYGVIKEEHQVEIFDMMVETMSLAEKIKEYNPELIGITSLCIDVIMVIRLAEEAKEYDKNIITMVGGTQSYLNAKAFYHPAIDHIFQYMDRENIIEFLSVIGKGEIYIIDGVLSRELDYASSGKMKRNEYLLPDRTSTEKYRKEYSYFGYKPAAIMEFGAGCEKRCDFCLRWRIEGYQERFHDIDLIKKELLSIKEPTIMLFDNDFFASREKLNTFISLIKELNLNKNYIVYGSVKGIVEFKKEIAEFKELGLKAVLVGYESFSDDELTDYRKKSTTDDNSTAALILKELKIDCWASFMAHPDWDKEDFKKLRGYIKTLRPEISSISPLTPFPNLPLYKKYMDRLIYSVEDYEKWSFGQVMIKPSKISLRTYYLELLKTNLYVNLIINKKTEMINNYGIKNIYKIAKGSLNSFFKYFKLMIQAKSVENQH